jgi:hypothetical protein
MKTPMSILLMVFALSTTSVFAAPHKDEHGNKHDKQQHGKKYDKQKHGKKHKHNKHADKKSISKKQAKSLIHQGWTPPGWHTRYNHGDILARDIYKRAKVLGRDRGIVRIKIDSTILHLVHDTHEIISILKR